MWGVGFYAVSETARARWETFPDDVADDFFVDALFQSHEKQFVPTEPDLVTPPQTTSALLRTLRRVYSPGGRDQIAQNDGFECRSSVRTPADVLRAMPNPRSNGRTPWYTSP